MEKELKKGEYVTTVINNSNEFGLVFILGRVESVNINAEKVVLNMYDFFYRPIYRKLKLSYYECPIKYVYRCKARNGALVWIPDEKQYGKILQIRSYAMKSGNRKNKKDKFNFYDVILDDGSTKRIREDKLEIDFSAPDFHPYKLLKAKASYNYNWYFARNKILKRFLDNESMPYGFNVLTGCRVFLMPHQITSILKMLESKPLRFMLADEVGLGKTIEAAAIIKILSTRNRHFRVVYVLPKTLISQWQNELKYKFNITAKCGNITPDDCHVIVPLEDIEKRGGLMYSKHGWDLLVVDEVHGLLNNKNAYNLIKKLSIKSPNVLLLSATPVQEREKELLCLLTLLQPEYYEKMRLATFSAKVHIQTDIMKKTRDITRRSSVNFEKYVSKIRQWLKELVENVNDKYVEDLFYEINFDHTDKAKKQVNNILAYISENYRLDKRLIRNRRCNINQKLLGIRKLEEYSYQMPEEFDGCEEDFVYREVVGILSQCECKETEYVENVIKPLFSAMFSSPWALKRVYLDLNIDNEYLENAINQLIKQVDRELKEIDFANDLIGKHSRLTHIVSYLYKQIKTGILEKTNKIVLFTEYIETLEKIHEVLKRNNIHHVQFNRKMTRGDIDANVSEFQNNKECQLIICDSSGGEGRNFQMADIVIHADLPWKINTLEQRIGRLDRLCRDKKHLPIKSVVFYAENTVEEQLFILFRDGIKIFHESLSGMEIVTAELDKMINKYIEEDVFDGLNKGLDYIINLMDDTKVSIEKEAQYDVLSTLYKSLSRKINAMLKNYNKSDLDYEKGLDEWAYASGMGLTYCGNNVYYYVPNETDVKKVDNSLIRIPYYNTKQKLIGVFDRNEAVQHEDYIFFSTSNIIHDSIVSNSIISNRGRCAAFEKSGDINFEGFVFTYIFAPCYKKGNLNGDMLYWLSYFMIYSMNGINKFTVAISKDGRIVLQDDELVVLRLDDNTNTSNVNLEHINLYEWENCIDYARRKALMTVTEYYHDNFQSESFKEEMNRIISSKESEISYLHKNKLSSEKEELKGMKKTFAEIEKMFDEPVLEMDSVCYIKVNKL